MQTQGVWGIGLKKASSMNRALLAKLAWRLMKKDEILWCSIVKSKYAAKGKGAANS